MNPLTPQQLSELLPSRPLITVPSGKWPGVELQLYRHPPRQHPKSGHSRHLLVLHMAGKVQIDDTTLGSPRREWADAGYFSLTPAGLGGFRSWKGRPEVSLVYIDPPFVREVAEDLGVSPSSVNLTPRVAAVDPVLHHLVTVLRFEATHLGSASRLMADSLVRALCVQLLRSHSDLSAAAWPSRPTLNFPRLNKVVDYMRANFDRPISLSELAGVCGLSATHFSHAFREALGKPPHAYLINLRLAHAIDLLEHTRLPVTEIALSCGFQQSQYFATLFRRKFGVTPSRWRIERGN